MDKKIIYFSKEAQKGELLKYYLLNEGIELSLTETTEDADNDLASAALLIYDKESYGSIWASDIQKLRGSKALLLVLLAEEDDIMAKLSVLSLGADLCLPGTTTVIELAAYIQAIIRRKALEDQEQGSVSYGDVSLSRTERTARVNSIPLNLTPNEFEFLLYLIDADRAVSKEELLSAVWGYADSYLRTNVAEDLVKRLRKKLREHKSHLNIEAIRGYGWRLSIDEH